MLCCFFLKAPPTTESYTLSLHDALPIYGLQGERRAHHADRDRDEGRAGKAPGAVGEPGVTPTPRIVVLSAPSGGGKTTIAKALRARYPDQFGFSVSATTRKPRAAEQDGVDYRFWKPSQFLAAVKDGQFLEHAQY